MTKTDIVSYRFEIEEETKPPVSFYQKMFLRIKEMVKEPDSRPPLLAITIDLIKHVGKNVLPAFKFIFKIGVWLFAIVGGIATLLYVDLVFANFISKAFGFVKHDAILCCMVAVLVIQAVVSFSSLMYWLENKGAAEERYKRYLAKKSYNNQLDYLLRSG